MPLERALIKNTVTSDEIHVQFNPGEYAINKDVNFAQIPVPGLESPLLQFVNGNLKTLELELFVDTYEAHPTPPRRRRFGKMPKLLSSPDGSTGTTTKAGQDVRDITRRITSLMDVDPKTHAPPLLLFVWGSLSLSCVLARVSERYIMFLPSGIPVRARLQVTFHEFVNAELQAKGMKTETADYSKLYVVGQGETLSGIAARVFEDPRLWRPIALHNRLDDPSDLPVGKRLLIPKLPYFDPETGEVME